MKLLLLFFLLLPSALVHAQAAEDRSAPACGLESMKFTVKTSPRGDLSMQPPAGKALIYFLQDDSAFQSRPRPSVRFGMDGSWVGATDSNSWFAIAVDPGKHHLCASWQSHVVLFLSNNQLAAVHLRAKTGKVYFFRMQNIFNRAEGLTVNFAPVDSDEGQILIRKFSYSTSRQKK